MSHDPIIPADPARIDGSALLLAALEMASAASARPNALHRLSGLAEAGKFAELLSEALMEQSKLVKAHADRIMERVIPDIMSDSEMDSFALLDGSAVQIKQDIKASLTQENRAAGLAWLREHGHDGVITWALTIPLGKGPSREQIAETMGRIRELGLSVHDDSKVNAQTLSALIRELIRDGDDLSGSSFVAGPSLAGFFVGAPDEDAKEGDSPAKKLGEKPPSELFGVFMRERAAIVVSRKRRDSK
jgi:hypothetical protein